MTSQKAGYMCATDSHYPETALRRGWVHICLNEHVFLSLQEAREIIECRRHDYNFLRPHSSLGALTPMEFVAQQADPSLALPPRAGTTSTLDSIHKRG
jgi:transposase InsO family protein